MRRFVAPAAALAFAFGFAGVRAEEPAVPPSATWLQRRLEAGLSEALGGTVRIGRIDVNWSTLAATVGDVSIAIPAEGAPPLTATLAEGRVQLAWSGIGGIVAGDIHITEVFARGASFSCSREWIRAFTPARKKKDGAVAVQVDRLVLQDATAEYIDGHQHVRVVTRSMDFRGDWSASRRMLVGEMNAGATIEAPLFGRPWSATVHGGLRLGGGRLEIFNATGNGPGAAAEMTGNVTWGSGASFTAEGRLSVDLAAISPYIVGTLPLSGLADGPVTIVLAGGAPIRVTMQADTTGLRIGPVVTDSARAELTVRPGHVDVMNLDARAYAGAFRGTVGLTFGQPIGLRTDLTGKGADLARLIAFAGKDLPIASSADVTLAVSGEAGRPATWTGSATFDAVPAQQAAAGSVPARGRGRVAFVPGHVRVDTEAVSLPGTSLRLALDAELTGAAAGVRLALDGNTTDGAATQRTAVRFLDALGVARNRFATEPVEGTGTFRATVSASGGSARFDLGLDLVDGSYGGERFSSGTLDLGVAGSTVAIRRLELKGDGASLSGRASFDAASGALDDVDLTARGVSIARLLAKAGTPAWVDGSLDFDLRGSREAGTFAARGTALARSVIAGREIIDTVQAPVLIEGGVVILDGLVVRGEGMEARGRVEYDLSKSEGTVEILSSRMDVASNRTVAEAGLSAKGTLRANGPIAIGGAGVSGTLRIAADDLVVDTGRSGLREVRLGEFEGTGTISSRGLDIALRAAPEAAWTFEAFLGFERRLPLSAVLYFENLVVGAGGLFGESADLRLKGQVQAEGDLTEPRAMEINGAFDEVAVRIGPRVVKAAESFPLRLDAGMFALGPAHFTGESADVRVSAAGSIETGEISGMLRGSLDLAIVSSLWSELRGSGQIDVDATLGGTVERPDLEGRVALHDGRLRLIGYPQSFESIDAEALFSGQTLTLSSFRAFQGGGEIRATGQVDFAGVVPASFRATFDGANVSAKFPEGFKGSYDGRMTVEGTPKRANISGRVNVVRGLYSKSFDIGLFGGAHREFDAAAESPFPRNIALDVDIVAPGNVLLRNDLARVEASGQLHIGGELARPEITGRFSLVPGGTVRYRDVDYRIEYGTLDLTDPKRINPYVDFRGRTRVAEYEITLHVEGTMDKFEYELSSTPPLSSQDIISLLVTGKTMDALSGQASAAAIPQDMAAYYFAGLLSATFGRQIQNSLGIDQLEITPLLLKGSADPTARITVGKQVSDTVKIAFSEDIGTAQKQTYQLSWDASRRVRLVAESGTETRIGGELQYSQQFGGTPVSKSAAVAGSPIKGEGEGGMVASVAVATADSSDRSALVKKSGIRPGTAYDRGKMLQGADRLRAAMVKAGFIQAGVRAETIRDVGSPDLVRIVYKISPGPRVDVAIEMSGGKGGRSMRKTFKSFSSETPYTVEFWDEAAHALLEQLQQSGYYAADVTWQAADGPAGRSVRILVDRGKPVRLRAIRFSGVSSIPLPRIEKLMASLKSKTMGKRLLRPALLTQDLSAVRSLYREEGFTRVRIAEPRITLAATGDAADVDVSIQEGPRFAIGSVAFSEGAALPDEDVRPWADLEPGETFSPRRLSEAEQAVKERLDALGYPDASVESRVDLSSGAADITFEVDPGNRKTVADIVISGNRITKNRTIAQGLTFGRGDLLSQQAFLKSQQQLYRTGLFSSVRLSSSPIDAEDGSAQRVTVKVDEAPPLALGLGVGYASSEGPRASFLLGYSNLGGRNVAITLQGRVSAKDDQGLLTVRRRNVFGKTIDSLGSLLYERNSQDGFTQTRRALSVRLEQKPKPRWIRFLRYTVQQVEIFDITDAEAALEAIFKDKLSSLRLGDLGLGLVRDTRDDAFLPTRGGYGSIESSVFAKPLASEASFLKLFVRGSWTLTFKGGSRFASFLRVGAEYPFADSEIVPISERFFAGGPNTLRGFATDTVGGLEVAGFNTGGEALLIFNEEWHFPIWRSLRGELFLDAGNVYPTIGDFKPTDLRSPAGAGFRLDTPIGPIRVEYGWKLDREPGESPGEFVFAIGTVF